MTNFQLYARLLAFFCTMVTTALVAHAAQSACAACIAVTIAPGQTLLLPENLHGLTVLLEASEDRTQSLAAGIGAVRERGGRPGVLLTPVVRPTDPDFGYRVKLQLTDIRSRLSADVLVALGWPGAAADAWTYGVAGYADVVVGGHTGPIPPGRRIWPAIEAVTTEDALELTRQGGAETWTLSLPADALEAARLLRELASAAAPQPDTLTEVVEVRGGRQLTAEEIVARNQAVARRQSSAVSHVISRGTLTLTFEAPGFPAPVTVVSDTTIYQGPGRTEFEQRRIRVNGIEFGSEGVPRLPIIEPERVAMPPLAISLTNQYRYDRDSDDTVNGVRCYVVTFEPIAAGASLYRGRAWISIEGFHTVRIAAVQTNLRGPIISSEQVDDFRDFGAGVWLLARSDVRQLYEGAGHRTPIHRLLVLDTAEANPEDFQERLATAYASAPVMLRDTAEGFRYLRRERPAKGESGGPSVVEALDRADRVRTVAAGLIIDPNISVPLPFAGLSYIDFNLFDTGAQLNAFFGGSYGQLAFSLPAFAAARWQIGGRAFGILSSFNDRSFRAGREIYDENVRQTPAHLSVWLLRPLTPRLAFRAGYEVDYTRLRAAPETSADFTVPADQLTHGVRAALEGQRAGWSGSLWWNGARRSGWREWGRGPDDFTPAHRDFQRFGLSLARSAVLTPRLVSRLELALASGRDLDRFSRYAFGTFDNRLRGYPSALVRYDRGGALRTAIAWTVNPRMRLDGFVDSAVVRDRGFGRSARNYTGIGAAIELPIPFAVLAALEWGYGIRGIRSDGSQGTHVIRVSAFKVF
jgi:hypothetical protein